MNVVWKQKQTQQVLNNESNQFKGEFKGRKEVGLQPEADYITLHNCVSRLP